MHRLQSITRILLLTLATFLHLFNLVGVFSPFFINFYQPPEGKEMQRFHDYVTDRLEEIADKKISVNAADEKARNELRDLSYAIKGFDLKGRELLHVLRAKHKGADAELRVYQIQKRSQFGLLHLKFQEQNGQVYLVRTDFMPLSSDIHAIRTVLLRRFSWPHALMWFGILVSLSLATHCIYTIIRHQWNVPLKWVLLLFLNVIILKLEWSSSNFDFKILSLHSDPYGFVQRDVHPWLLELSLPIGPLMLFMRLRRQRAAYAKPTKANENGS